MARIAALTIPTPVSPRVRAKQPSHVRMTPRNLSIVSLGVTKVHASAIRANPILASRPAPIQRKRPVMPMVPQKRNLAIMAVTASSVPKNRTILSARHPAPIQRRRPVILMVPKTRNLVIMAVTESCVLANRALVRGLRARTMAAATAVSV